MVLKAAFPRQGSDIDLIDDDPDRASQYACIACLGLGGVGFRNIYMNAVTSGMIIAVLAARAFAYVVTKHIDTKAATDLATFQFVERVAKKSLLKADLSDDDKFDILPRIRKLEQGRSLMRKPPGVNLL